MYIAIISVEETLNFGTHYYRFKTTQNNYDIVFNIYIINLFLNLNTYIIKIINTKTYFL
jgi:hypothetical protein